MKKQFMTFLILFFVYSNAFAAFSSVTEHTKLGADTLSTTSVNATTFYVSPTGSDHNQGTIESPWKTLNKAWTVISAGDIIYMRGGTYHYTDRQSLISKDGNSSDTIKIFAYPGESPIIDFGTSSDLYFGVFLRNCDYVHIKGIRITDLPQPQNPIDASYGLMLWDDVNHCAFELMETDHIGGWGVVLGDKCSDILFLNCDSHHNADPISGYGGADGFESGSHGAGTSTDITFRGCRAWSNSDDGWDLRQADGIYTIENCWTFRNGYREDGVTEGGNGDGFKLGGSSEDPASLYPNGTTNILRVIKNSLAFENRMAGITPEPDSPEATLGLLMYNCTAYGNELGIQTGNHGNYTLVRNCVAYNNNEDARLQTGGAHDHNNFDIPISTSNSDFQSVSSTGMDGARQADGSLPDLDFLKLSPSSSLIDAGVDVGLPYYGALPDLGAYETGSGTSSSPLEINNSSYIIYPNPVNDILYISVKGGVKEMSLNLYDILGIELYKSVKTGDCKLDMGKYQPGIYFLQVICEGKTDIRKIMKN